MEEKEGGERRREQGSRMLLLYTRDVNHNTHATTHNLKYKREFQLKYNGTMRTL